MRGSDPLWPFPGEMVEEQNDAHALHQSDVAGAHCRWMMEEAGQPYETVYLDYATTMKQPPYIDINPMGKVPRWCMTGGL